MKPKLLLTVMALFAAAAFLAAGIVIGVQAKSELEKVAYPGARPLADTADGSLEPNIYYWRKDFYATEAPLYDVYRWYTNKLGLSLRTPWKRGCMTLATQTVRYGIENEMEVTICDGEFERMIILERSFKFSWP